MKKQSRTWCYLTLILLLLPPQLKAQKASTANPTNPRAETVTYNNFVYKTDFEDVVKDTYDEEIITINGIRWKCIHAKIETDPLRTIPEGKKALALKAYRSHVNEEGCTTFEMLDDLPEGANKVSFEAVAYGQDGLFTPDGWQFEYSTDQGATWAFQKFSMPARPEVVEYSVETFEPTRFRIRYLPDPPESDKKGQRLLIDALRVTHNDDFNTPARIMMNLYNGYQTSNNYLTFSPDFRGEFGLADPDNPNEWTDMFNSYIEVRLDGEVVKKITAIPEDYVAKIENISAGDHQLEIELKHVGTEQVWGARQADSQNRLLGKTHRKHQGTCSTKICRSRQVL